MVIHYAKSTPAKTKPTSAKEMATLSHLPEKEYQAQLAAAKLGRGRRPSGNETVTLRVDKRAVEFFKTYGEDWKKAMNDALIKAAHL